MTTDHDRALTFTADQLTRALLEVSATARWPDGPLLVDLDSAVLREQLAPRLLTALAAAAPGTCPPPTRRCGPGVHPQPQPADPHVTQEQPC